VGHCVEIEKLGFPTAPIVTVAFKDLAKSNAASRGMPYERICFTPHPLASKTDEQMYHVLEGSDPVTGKPLMKEIIDALTVPLTTEEKKTGTVSPDVGPRTYVDTAENLQRYYADNGLTDFLPIILPTGENVDAMLKGTSHHPDETVGKMSAALGAYPEWTFTVRQVAINAVMAGAQPQFLPVILAIASTGITSLFSSTGSFARMLVVNGPVRNEITMNSGIGALGPFNAANATIGRAWTLLSKNLGGAGVAGATYWGTQGNTSSYNNLCFPETEEKLPNGWQPLHVQKGFKPNESVVSVFSGWSMSDVCWFSLQPMHQVIQHWLTHFFSTEPGAATLLLDPIVANLVKDEGFATKDDFSEWLSKNSSTPAWLYWDLHSNTDELKQAKAGVEPYASYLKVGDDDEIPVSRYVRTPRPKASTDSLQGNAAGYWNVWNESGHGLWGTAATSSVELVVLGGETNQYWSGGDFAYVTSASVDKWR
jgi:hypothetical protein